MWRTCGSMPAYVGNIERRAKVLDLPSDGRVARLVAYAKWLQIPMTFDLGGSLRFTAR